VTNSHCPLVRSRQVYRECERWPLVRTKLFSVEPLNASRMRVHFARSDGSRMCVHPSSGSRRKDDQEMNDHQRMIAAQRLI